MSSDSDDDGSTGRGGGGSADSNAGGGFGMDLTGILFGNIDSEGRLMDDDAGNAFDPEFREHISSLSKYVYSKAVIAVVIVFFLWS